jgi:hypothetical protein
MRGEDRGGSVGGCAVGFKKDAVGKGGAGDVGTVGDKQEAGASGRAEGISGGAG